MFFTLLVWKLSSLFVPVELLGLVCLITQLSFDDVTLPGPVIVMTVVDIFTRLVELSVSLVGQSRTPQRISSLFFTLLLSHDTSGSPLLIDTVTVFLIVTFLTIPSLMVVTPSAPVPGVGETTLRVGLSRVVET